jgi:hypothetical protein
MPPFVTLELRNDCPEMQDALQARVHDPLWFLARQWQLGEFKGDDAGSPAAAQLIVRSAMVSRFLPGPLPADPDVARARATDYSPRLVPLETLVEREPVHHPGPKNLRLAAASGLHLLRLLQAHDQAKYRPLFRKAFLLQRPAAAERESLDDDTLRYLEVVAGRTLDGVRLHQKLAQLRQGGGLPALFAEAPFDSVLNEHRSAVVQAMTAWLTWYEGLFNHADSNPAWVRDRMEYSFSLSGQTAAGETVLNAPEYLEGHLDWYSFVVDPMPSLGATGEVPSVTATFLPTPVSFRGMPAPRLWEFEDGRVNFGRVEASPQDIGRLLVVEFGLVYGNDWFVVPVELMAGSLCRIGALIVMNTFGERMLIPSTTTADGTNTAWRMFALSPSTSGTPAVAKSDGLFFLPPVLGANLEGPHLEEVLLLRDEMANLAWAIERVVESASNRPLNRFEACQELRRRADRAETPAPSEETATGRALTYRLGTDVPEYWVPLFPVQTGAELRLKRGSLPRLGEGSIEGTFEPQGVILEPGRELLLHDEEVPREGARVTRGFQYARWTDGSTHVWIGRRKQPGRGEGSSGLRFDVAE